MNSRAQATVYWPGILNNIRSTRYNCQHCNNIAPSQPSEPMIVSITPEYPFQYLCADYFELNGHNYLSVVDRFSGWIMVYHSLKSLVKN